MAFDVEYSRWLEELKKQANDLRTAVNAHAGDNDLRIIVDGIMAHYTEIFRLKSVAAKTDVFHILSGMWKTPAERCFLWLGGFRSSDLLKLLIGQLEPLTDQQISGIKSLQQSSQQAEEALSQGMEALQQSLADTLASNSPGPVGPSGTVANYMGQMAMAMGKLGTLETFVRQQNGWMPVPQFGGWEQKAAATNYSVVFQQARANRKQKKTDFASVSIGNDQELVTHQHPHPRPPPPPHQHQQQHQQAVPESRRRARGGFLSCCFMP